MYETWHGYIYSSSYTNTYFSTCQQRLKINNFTKRLQLFVKRMQLYFCHNLVSFLSVTTKNLMQLHSIH